MAKLSIMEINTMGSMLIFSAKFTTNGPNSTPKTLKV